MDDIGSLGDRVAFYRRRRGLSQVELAQLLERSESWVSQVERGVRRVDRLSVRERLADALDIPLGELTGEPGPVSGAGDDTPAVEELRLALSGHPAPQALFGGRAAPEDLDQLSADVARAWELVHASAYEQLGRLAAALIARVETTLRVHDRRRRTRLLRLLAETYQVASALLAKVGDLDAAWVAADRGLRAAEDAGDPLTVLAGQFRMAHAFLAAGRLDQARHAAAQAAAAIDEAGEQPPTTSTLALRGALELVQAMVAAREGNRTAAYRYLDVAADLAKAVGPGRDDFGTEFGPANVAVHRVAAAVELGDAGLALDVAERLDIAQLSPERQSRFLIDVARAQAQRRQSAEVLQALLRAEELAPEQVRDHPLVRQLVRDDLQRAGRRTPADLKAFALRIGVLPQAPS